MNDNADEHGSGDLVTAEELVILRLVADGLPLVSVAQHVGMSPRTVRRRIRGLCDRLGLAHSIQAVVWATRRGLI
jgi:DNA-binding NarL/FixJ family response regulator